MTVAELVTLLAQLSGLVFVVTSMIAMGLSLTLGQVLAPLRDLRLVVLALVANFVLVPALAYATTQILQPDAGVATAVVILGAAAGAPFLPKLVQFARADIAVGVGLMVLLMVVTVGYLPVVLPLMLPGASVDPGAIAQSLIVLMLVPLGLALLVRDRDPALAAEYAPLMNKTSTVALLVLFVVGLGLNLPNILGLIGTGGIVALLVVIVGSLVIGAVLGAPVATARVPMTLGTAQRNVSAALVVGAQAGDATVISTLLVGAILLLVVLMPLSRQLGVRAGGSVSAARG
jgi:predicted Na+-dependent transporter